MAGNTITQTTLLTSRAKVIKHIALVSDGTEETDLVIYDSSVVATALGIADPLTCRLDRIEYSVSSATSFITLEFDASTDVMVAAIPSNASGVIDFRQFGGIRNTSGTGITGDITLTTTGLASGDSLHIVIEVSPL